MFALNTAIRLLSTPKMNGIPDFWTAICKTCESFEALPACLRLIRVRGVRFWLTMMAKYIHNYTWPGDR